jgi:hypothetical protein
VKKIIIVALLLSLLNIFISSAQIEKFYSPNKKIYLITQKNKENSILYILVFNHEGNRHLPEAVLSTVSMTSLKPIRKRSSY